MKYMKETIKTSRTAGYLEKMFRQLNADKFDGKLEEPIITIQSTPRAYGHVTCGKVWKSKDTNRYELNLGAGTLDRPIESVVSTLLHEMVHIYHLMNGIQDCSRGNTYHNKKFKAKAEEVGLVIDYDSRIGFSITSPSEKLIDYIISQGWSDILINRNEYTRVAVGGTAGKSGAPDDAPKVRKPSSTRKMICPNCGCTCRVTKDISIICGECYDSTEEIVHMIKES